MIARYLDDTLPLPNVSNSLKALVTISTSVTFLLCSFSFILLLVSVKLAWYLVNIIILMQFLV